MRTNTHICVDKVSLVITSCGRIDLLKKTLDSFFEHNTHPIERYIVTEDSGDRSVFEECNKLNESYDNIIEFVFNYEKLGQTKSIDKAYSKIITPYVFHCEDDWEFYRGGFIEKSLMVLKSCPSILQCWIRPASDGHLNHIAKKCFETPGGVPYRKVLPVSFFTGRKTQSGDREIVRDYMGFSFNPGLKRMSDYHSLGSGGYHSLGQEHLIDHHYRDLGYSVVSLSIDNTDGFVRHIGQNRHVENTVF